MLQKRTELREKLQNELRKLFQFDVSDLDFGIYRILNRKKDQIEHFIEKDLLDAVSEGLKAYQKQDDTKVEELKQKVIENLSTAAFDEEGKLVSDFHKTPLGQKYLKALESQMIKEAGIDIEKKIYNDLYTFFSRYYCDGDFLTQRRISTRGAKYAIPHNGEEVLLHWANKDQYFIKTGEYFRNYKFTAGDITVWFKVDNADVPKDNTKDEETKYFVLKPDYEYYFNKTDNELSIYFEYRKLNEQEKQDWVTIFNKSRNKSDQVKGIDREKLCKAYELYFIEEFDRKLRAELFKPIIKDGETLFFNKLNHYTAKNSTDYFIHKNLEGFLERELEYYLKHEVIRVDDFIDDPTQKSISKALTRAKVVRGIAKKIIAFLSQIENFQKKLFEKRKFIVDTNYCFTIDKVPAVLYESILNNAEQLNCWEQLYRMQKWSGNLEWDGKWTVRFLKEHGFLMIDTKYFDLEFKEKVLMNNEPLNDSIEGVLINSENFQAISLIKNKYQDAFDCIYIDPPYNTVHSEIIYKNQFKHSSWLALINNTTGIGKKLLKQTGTYGFAIDDYEFPNLRRYLEDEFSQWDVSTIVVNHHPQGSGGKLSRTHEYYLICSNTDSDNLLGKNKDDYIEERQYMRAGRARNNYRYGRWKSFYALLLDPQTNRIVGVEDPVPLDQDYPTEDINGLNRIYPINTKNEERVWRNSYLTGRTKAENGELIISDKGTVYQIIHHIGKREVLFSNWTDSKFNAGPHGTEVLDDLGIADEFDYPKSIYTMETGLIAQTFNKQNALILDYFAGSGTTAHAVLNLNKDEGKIKYVMVEMGEHFNTALKPRIQKVVFSQNWKDGVPQDRDGQSHAFKYHFFESYEDALNNIDFKNPDDTQQAMEFEDYMLSYMLDFETDGVSATLLKDSAFETPFDYQLYIQRGYESPAPEPVDLVETFNYLIGLWLITIRRYKHQERKYVISIGQIRNEDSIDEVIIIWRNTKDLDLDEEAEWITSDIIKEKVFERVYVNGQSKIPGAEPTEITFREKMFEDLS